MMLRLQLRLWLRLLRLWLLRWLRLRLRLLCVIRECGVWQASAVLLWLGVGWLGQCRLLLLVVVVLRGRWEGLHGRSVVDEEGDEGRWHGVGRQRNRRHRLQLCSWR